MEFLLIFIIMAPIVFVLAAKGIITDGRTFKKQHKKEYMPKVNGITRRNENV